MLTAPDLDTILTLQLAFAWAGEAGDEDEPRLGWWKTDMLSEYGGYALFARVCPRTAPWAAYETAREAAIRVDADCRAQDAERDHLQSLFSLGFEVDEQVQDRLRELKLSERPPHSALPRLAKLPPKWDADAFKSWLATSETPTPKTKQDPAGLRIVSAIPPKTVGRVNKLAAVLGTLPDQYPCAHYNNARSAP